MIWGENNAGQLGDSSLINADTAEQVAGLNGITAVGAGASHTLALKSDGTIMAWGRNLNGQLGDSTNTDRAYPVRVKNLNSVVKIFAQGNKSLALKNDSSVWIWGSNAFGQLGIGSPLASINYPIRVDTLSKIIDITAGNSHSLALNADGTVWAWGLNQHGGIGDGSMTNRTKPVKTLYITGITKVAAGGFHSLALKNDGTVWTWGMNWQGEIGDGTLIDKVSPTQVYGLNSVVAIAGGIDHSIALKNDGTVWTWGFNSNGQLGNGSYYTTGCRCDSFAYQVPGLSGIIGIAAGGDHSLALKNDGTLWAWGLNIYGELGLGYFSGGACHCVETPTQVIDLCTVLGVEDMKGAGNNVSVYTNPAQTEITVDFNFMEKVNTIEIKNVLGQTIKELKAKDSKMDIDVSALQSGIYFIIVKNSKESISRKFIKE